LNPFCNLEKGGREMVIDPVCNMQVDEEDAEFTTEYDGKTYYFCLESCKEEFETDPEEYLTAA
jgi:YHS domain-containing protein